MPESEELTSVKFRSRIVYGFIDFFVFFFVWIFTVFVLAVEIPHLPINGYTKQKYDSYILVMTIFISVCFIISVINHKIHGGSAAKILTNYRTINIDGSYMSWRQSIIRSSILYLSGVCILASKPIAMLFGGEFDLSEITPLSISIVFIGIFILIPTMGLMGDRSLLEQWLGIVTTKRKAD